MKLDDRDIMCEQDYTPLSNAELVTQIEWHAAAMSGASAYVLERITGPARALLARAEAAEARVAEMEAQATQGWRPVMEQPPLPDEYYLTDDTLPDGNEPWIVNYYSAAHGWANRCRVWLCPPPLPPDKNAGAE
jgi:hypothetical protein